MLRFLCCFLCAMESLLVLGKGGGDVAIASPFILSAPLVCSRDRSLPVPSSIFSCFLSKGALRRRNPVYSDTLLRFHAG
jgi:hypothetical protein